MSVNTCVLVLLLLAIPAKAETLSARAAAMSQAAPSGPALTIAELSAQARQKRLAEDSGPAATAAPPGMTIVPSTAIVKGAVAAAGAEGVPAKPAKPAPPPEILPGLLAIVKTPAGGRYVELTDAAGARKYTAGQVMPSGWTVGTIGARSVALSRPAGKRERQITLSLSNQ